MAAVDSIHDIFMSLRGRLARSILGIVPPKEIEDIVQETYVRVCQVKRQDLIREPRSFLFETAHNLALDHVKRAEYRLAVRVEEMGESEFDAAERPVDETFNQVASDEEFYQFCEAVRNLPVKCRRAFVLKKVYGCSQCEIAREMNISESTVEKHIAQGIKRCAYFMQQHGARCPGGNQFRNPKETRRVSTPHMKGRT